MKLKHLNNSPKLWLFAALMFLIGQSFSQTKDISGVYNKYIKVTAIPSPCAVMVDSIQEFEVGDQFLLIQMKGDLCHSFSANQCHCKNCPHLYPITTQYLSQIQTH